MILRQTLNEEGNFSADKDSLELCCHQLKF